MGSGITRLLSPNQGSDLLHGLKISHHNIFPHNKVCVHRISWPRYITSSCFQLAAVHVIRSPGWLTKGGILFFSFVQNLQTLVTILIYKNSFGPLGYSVSAYVMVGPERYHYLRFGAWLFSGERTPALNDYAHRRPSCLLESIERLYQSSFIFYTGPQSHYTQRKLGPKAPEWLRKSHGKSKP